MEHSDLNADDNITLFTDDEQVTVRKINLIFSQKSRLRGHIYEFTLFNDHQCYQKLIHRLGARHKFRVNVACLDPEPRHNFRLNDSWLISSVISGILGLLLLYAGWIKTPPMRIDYPLLVGLACFSLGASMFGFLVGFLRAYERMFLFSRVGDVPVIELIKNRPNRVDYERFVSQFKERVEQARQAMLDNNEDLVSHELKELRRLRNEGVLTEARYQYAKRRLDNAQTNPEISHA